MCFKFKTEFLFCPCEKMEYYRSILSARIGNKYAFITECFQILLIIINKRFIMLK